MNGPSEFYPPRANGWTSVRQRWFQLRRVLPVENLVSAQANLPVSPSKILLSLLIPAYGFHVLKYPRIALSAATLYVLALAVYIFWTGYFASALAIMIGIHASSAGHVFKRITPNFGLALRLLCGFTLFAFAYSFLYGPMNERLGKLVMPLRVGKNIIVVNRFAAPEKIQRGDWIAYRIVGDTTGGHGNALAVVNGYGFSRALAVPGDTISFSPEKFFVNGVEHPAKPHMPTNDTWTLSEKQWFVWPELAIGGNRTANEAQISAAFQEHSVISEKEFVGKPFRHWFWKRQIF